MATYLNKISNINVAEYLCNNENDLADIHIKDIAPGSTAYCIKECKNYILDEDKKWKEFDLENKSNGGGGESSTKYCRLEVGPFPYTDAVSWIGIESGDRSSIGSVDMEAGGGYCAFYLPKDKGIYLHGGPEIDVSGKISFFDLDTDVVGEIPPFFEANIDSNSESNGYCIPDISNFPDDFAINVNLSPTGEQHDPE